MNSAMHLKNDADIPKLSMMHAPRRIFRRRVSQKQTWRNFSKSLFILLMMILVIDVCCIAGHLYIQNMIPKNIEIVPMIFNLGEKFAMPIFMHGAATVGIMGIYTWISHIISKKMSRRIHLIKLYRL